MLKQRLQQKLLQKLSPQQIQLMKLLQLPTVLLEQRIKEEIEENPALEEGEDDEIEDVDDSQVEDFDDEFEGDVDDRDFDEPENDPDNEFDISDYIEDDEIPNYKLASHNISADDEHKEIPISSSFSFQEYLLSQLGLRDLSEQEELVAKHIIGNIDDAGYLQRDIHSLIDDLAFSLNIKTDFKEVLCLLRIVQEFDPPGVGARDLQECLLLQIRRKKNGNKTIDDAALLLEKNFNDFTKKHYHKIQKKHNLSDEELKAAIDEILKLNPKPGNTLTEAGRSAQYVVPDFIITAFNGDLEVTLNSRNAPELKINRTYAEMLEAMAEQKGKGNTRQKEAMMFVKQKLDGAKWFIDAIRQRQNTLLVTMEAILNFQKEYFLTGDETKIRPMILKDIADIVNLDISTISRVANSKYVQTPYGTFLLKTLFSESLQNEEGEEVSTREVKKILQDCIGAEDKAKPLTDEQLTKILKDKGYHIARRTVAKYREQLNIPVARLRKELV
ncbi:MAG: RNA polymerase sigma-54 factor [Bacteroidetes bacterium]|nr:MAG: RNA polymerase sigma-54 factor [Bacteroidota bacterium]